MQTQNTQAGVGCKLGDAPEDIAMRCIVKITAALTVLLLAMAWAGCSGMGDAPTATVPVSRGPAPTLEIASPTETSTPETAGGTPTPAAPATQLTETPGDAPPASVTPPVLATASATMTVSPAVAVTREAALPTPAPAATAMAMMEESAPDTEAAMDKGGTEAVASAEAAHGDSAGEPYQPTTLSAGEVDDNERWEEYLEYLEQYGGPPVHRVDVSERYIITVLDNSGRPVPNALVRVSSNGDDLFAAPTYANGQTLFFPKALALGEGVESFRVSAEKNGTSLTRKFSRGDETEWQLTLDVETSYEGGVPLDVLFLLDSTGSMADEIDQIKTTLLSISARIADLPAQPDLRFGMVSYRDRGDEYVTRLFDFDDDVSRFSNTIRGVQADGGGDTPESLNEALHVAIQRPEWRTGDAIRLVFLLADAPPHLDYQDDFDYAVEMVEARKRGIKIFSVASSGLDAQGEYIFRQIAQHTMGRFIFLLYAGYGEGLGTPHNVEEYTVERLDDLVVRLIEEELAVLAEE